MDKYEYIGFSVNGFREVIINNKAGFIDSNDKEICEIKYDIVWDFYTGFAKVLLNGKYGYINIEGCEIVKCKYNDIEVNKLLRQYKLNINRKNKIESFL
jgi:hypothetical protein